MSGVTLRAPGGSRTSFAWTGPVERPSLSGSARQVLAWKLAPFLAPLALGHRDSACRAPSESGIVSPTVASEGREGYSPVLALAPGLRVQGGRVEPVPFDCRRRTRPRSGCDPAPKARGRMFGSRSNGSERAHRHPTAHVGYILAVARPWPSLEPRVRSSVTADSQWSGSPAQVRPVVMPGRRAGGAGTDLHEGLDHGNVVALGRERAGPPAAEPVGVGDDRQR